MTGPTAAAPVSLLLRAQAWLMLVLTTLFWGGNAVAGKLAVGEVSPMLLTWLRWTLAALLMLVVARHHLRQDWPVIRRRLPYLAMMGALGFTGFSGLLYSGLIRTTAINATIIQAGMPMFIFVLNLVIFRTASRPLQLVGYTITLVGVATRCRPGRPVGLGIARHQSGRSHDHRRCRSSTPATRWRCAASRRCIGKACSPHC